MILAPKNGRPNPNQVDLPWRTCAPCPCGLSANTYEHCCMRADGYPFIRVPTCVPPPPITGHANARCYMYFTNDCSEKTSREHYVSKNVLDQFGGKLQVSGFAWQQPGAKQMLPPDALVAKVLCERHNNALSPLDTYAGAALEALAQAMHHATKTSLTERTGYFLASGDALERWAVKVVLGTYFGAIATAEGRAIKGEHDVAVEALSGYMLGAEIPSPLGMYAESHIGAIARRDFGFAALTEPTKKEVVGLHMMSRGLAADFMMSLSGGLPLEKIYRPYVCEYNGPKRTARAILTFASAPVDRKKVSMRLALDRR